MRELAHDDICLAQGPRKVAALRTRVAAPSTGPLVSKGAIALGVAFPALLSPHAEALVGELSSVVVVVVVLR